MIKKTPLSHVAPSLHHCPSASLAALKTTYAMLNRRILSRLVVIGEAINELHGHFL
jgi:hypothetical protein